MLGRLWTWRRRWMMMLGQLGVGWVEAQSDQALEAPLGSVGLDCASSGSALQDLRHWWHCAQDEEVPGACLQLLTDRTVLPLRVHDQPYDQWRDGRERLEKLQDSPSCQPASQAVDNTELVGRPTSALLMPAELQVGIAAAVVVVVAVAAAVVEDPCEPGGTLKTDRILPKSGEPCRGTEGWETCEVGSRGTGVERTAARQIGKQGSWRALQAEPDCCEGGWVKATLVLPSHPGPSSSLALAPHFQWSSATPSHLSGSHLPPPLLLHQLCCTPMTRPQQPFVHGSRGNHATSGQSWWMNQECRHQATAVAAAVSSPCLVHPSHRTDPLDLSALDRLGSSGSHPRRHHSNQHPAYHCHPSSAAAVVAAPRLAAVQSAGAAPFAAAAPTAAVSAAAPMPLAAAPAVSAAVPQHTAPWWARTAEAAVQHSAAGQEAVVVALDSAGAAAALVAAVPGLHPSVALTYSQASFALGM